MLAQGPGLLQGRGQVAGERRPLGRGKAIAIPLHGSQAEVGGQLAARTSAFEAARQAAPLFMPSLAVPSRCLPRCAAAPTHSAAAGRAAAAGGCDRGRPAAESGWVQPPPPPRPPRGASWGAAAGRTAGGGARAQCSAWWGPPRFYGRGGGGSADEAGRVVACSCVH